MEEVLEEYVHLSLPLLLGMNRWFIDGVDRRICQVEKQGEKSIAKIILVMVLLPHLHSELSFHNIATTTKISQVCYHHTPSKDGLYKFKYLSI